MPSLIGRAHNQNNPWLTGGPWAGVPGMTNGGGPRELLRPSPPTLLRESSSAGLVVTSPCRNDPELERDNSWLADPLLDNPGSWLAELGAADAWLAGWLRAASWLVNDSTPPSCLTFMAARPANEDPEDDILRACGVTGTDVSNTPDLTGVVFVLEGKMLRVLIRTVLGLSLSEGGRVLGATWGWVEDLAGASAPAGCGIWSRGIPSRCWRSISCTVEAGCDISFCSNGGIPEASGLPAGLAWPRDSDIDCDLGDTNRQLIWGNHYNGKDMA